MAYFINSNNEQVRIDNGNNVFHKGKCRNGKDNNDWLANVITKGVQDGDLKPGLAVEVTGHLSSFEYGHTRDEDGKPVCIKVNTGHKSW